MRMDQTSQGDMAYNVKGAEFQCDGIRNTKQPTSLPSNNKHSAVGGGQLRDAGHPDEVSQSLMLRDVQST